MLPLSPVKKILVFNEVLYGMRIDSKKNENLFISISSIVPILYVIWLGEFVDKTKDEWLPGPHQ